MSRSTLEQLRLPVALLLIAVAAFVFWPRGDGEATSANATPSPSVVIGQPGGEVIPASVAPSVAATPIPTVSAAASPVPTATPAPKPTPEEIDGFTAEVLVCRSISGSECTDELSTVPSDASSFTALVRFTDANGGDSMNAVLSGQSGTIPGGAYTLQGGGDGYYYSTFQAGNLPAGDYTVTATRNGNEVATTEFRKEG